MKGVWGQSITAEPGCVPAAWEEMSLQDNHCHPHFQKFSQEIRGPNEELDTPERRPVLEKNSFEGKRYYFSVGGPISLPF